VRIAVVVALVLAALAAAVAVARAGPFRTAGPPRIAENVTVGGVPVGGLTRVQARRSVEQSFEAPIELMLAGETWRATPTGLGAQAAVADAVDDALGAPSGSSLDLIVVIDGERLHRYVATVARRYSRPAVDSTVRLRRGSRPFVTVAHDGVRVLRRPLGRALEHALLAHERSPIELPHTLRRPRVTRANFGPVLVVRRESKRLVLYDGMRRKKVFGIATGQASYPTPLGRFEIETKQAHPWWYPPASDWAAGLEPVPPGPGNPLGTRWMGLGDAVGIHGTPDAASIGYSASHGCIRMHISDAESLFERVSVGTPVFIVPA
jgi:hypothetical protein